MGQFVEQSTKTGQFIGGAAGRIGVHHKQGDNLVPGVGAQNRFKRCHVDGVALDIRCAEYLNTHRFGLNRP